MNESWHFFCLDLGARAALHVLHMIESCLVYVWAMAHVNESWHFFCLYLGAQAALHINKSCTWISHGTSLVFFFFGLFFGEGGASMALHVSHMNDSRLIYGWVMAHMNKLWHYFVLFFLEREEPGWHSISHIWMTHVWYMDESWRTWMSHGISFVFTFMGERSPGGTPCLTYE